MGMFVTLVTVKGQTVPRYFEAKTLGGAKSKVRAMERKEEGTFGEVMTEEAYEVLRENEERAKWEAELTRKLAAHPTKVREQRWVVAYVDMYGNTGKLGKPMLEDGARTAAAKLLENDLISTVVVVKAEEIVPTAEETAKILADWTAEIEAEGKPIITREKRTYGDSRKLVK